MRNAVEGGAAAEAVSGTGPGSEEAVGDCLREEVSKILGRQCPDQVGLESLEKPRQDVGRVLFLRELPVYDIAKEARALGQFHGQGFRRERLGQGEVEKAVEEFLQIVGLFDWRGCAQSGEHEGTGRKNRLYPLSIAVKAKLEEVRQDEIGEGTAIAFELFRLLYEVKALLRGLLGLDIADDPVCAVPEAEIRVACIGWFRERCDANMFPSRRVGCSLQHVGECGVEAFFPRVALPGHRVQLLEVVLEQRPVTHVSSFLAAQH